MSFDMVSLVGAAPSHNLFQWWLTVELALRDKFQLNLSENKKKMHSI